MLTNTGYIEPGTYDLIVQGTDRDHAHTLAMSVTVTGFQLSVPWDSYATVVGVPVTYLVRLDGGAWPTPVALSIDPTALANHFVVQLPAPGSIPANPTVTVKALRGTPAGVYELPLMASSAGYTQTVVLFVIVQSDPNATDLQLQYVGDGAADSDVVIAGEIYTYFVKARNISTNPAQGVIITDTTFSTTYTSLVTTSGCTEQSSGDSIELSCSLGTIPTYSETAGTAIAWQVAADAPDDEVLVHTADVAAQAGAYTETSTFDNLAERHVVVNRLSDISVTAQSSVAVAGQSYTLSATVRNDGPSMADDVEVNLYLPPGVSLQSATMGCVEEEQLILCNPGALAAAAQTDITVTVRVAQDVRTTLETLIEANSASDDPDMTNNADYAVTEISATAQLAVQVAPVTSTAQVNEGDVVDFAITVTNQGPSQATDMSLALNLPPNSDVVNVVVNDTTNSLEHFTVDAGETLTATVSVLFLEDSTLQNVQLGAMAQAVESTQTQGNSPNFTVLNTNPTAILSDTLTVNEGEWGVLTVHIDDAGTTYDPLSAQWDLNNDGSFDDGDGASVLFDARAIDGTTTRPIAVQVKDDDGGEIGRAHV